MKKIEITCDACGADLTDSGAMPSYMLVLSCSRIASTSDIRYAVAVSPHIEQDMHFCNVKCLLSKLSTDTKEAES